MVTLTITDSFVSALTELDASDAKRVIAFLDKLVREPSARGLRPEIVHDAADRTIRSYKVTHDLRAIAHIEGDTVLLLFVARHDKAYAWARDRCIECHPVTGEIQVVADPSQAVSRLAAAQAVNDAQRIAASAARIDGGLFDGVTDDALLSAGVPASWLATIRMVRTDDMLLSIAGDLPAAVAERLIDLAVERGTADASSRQALESGAQIRAAGRTWLCVSSEDVCHLLEMTDADRGLGV